MLLRDMCLPANLVTTPARYPSDVKKKKNKIKGEERGFIIYGSSAAIIN